MTRRPTRPQGGRPGGRPGPGAGGKGAGGLTEVSGGRRPGHDRRVPTGPAWQNGTVECEPVPQVLTAEEVAGATCLSVPQPDGSSRYVAVGGDGVVRTVAFGADGKVGRSPDRQVPGGVAPGAPTVVPTPAGDVQVTVRVKAPVTVDVG